MDVKVEIVKNKEEELTIIQTVEVTSAIQQAVELLSNSMDTITGVKDNSSHIIPIKQIYYIEAVDNKTFISLKNEVYESKLKLYELEEILDNQRFMRSSKSMILNVRKIKNVKSDLNARFVATLLNEENVVISRSYSKDLKRLLGL